MYCLWLLEWLVPPKTFAVLKHVLCTSYKSMNQLTVSLIQSCLRGVHVRLVVTCHLHFWQNDRDLLCATAVTRGWNGYRNKSAQKADLEKKIPPPFLPRLEHATFRSWVRHSNRWAITAPLWAIPDVYITSKPPRSFQSNKQFVRSQVKVRLIVHDWCHSIKEEDWENEVEWTGKVRIRKAGFPAVGEACKAIFYPSPDLWGRTFYSSGLSTQGTLISKAGLLKKIRCFRQNHSSAKKEDSEKVCHKKDV